MTGARIRASIEAYVAAWNERDAAQRMRFIEQACADDLILRTAGRRIEGRAQLDALIADFQQRRPGERAVLVSEIDVQGSLFRYVGIVQRGSEARAAPDAPENLDTGECDDDGRIRLLLTFAGATTPTRTA